MNSALPDSEERALFDALYHCHNRVVYAFLFGNLGDTETSSDLLQETFIRVWRHIGEVRRIPEERRRFWLFAIARNLLIDYSRKQVSREKRESSLMQNSLPSSTDPLQAAIESETATRVEEAIRCLPEALREVLSLQAMAGLSSSEIGSMLGRPPGTVRWQLSQARARVAEALGLNLVSKSKKGAHDAQ